MKKREYRCPWCGSITKPLGLRTEMIKKCCNCGNKYTYHKYGVVSKFQNLLFLLSCVCCLLFLINTWLSTIIVCILFIISFSFYSLMSYERVDDEKKFTYKKYKAKFTFTESEKNFRNIKRRYFLQDKSIVPICFVTDNNIALSNIICICMEDTKKITETEFECIFSFLPLSNVSFDVKENNIKFFFFKDYKMIGIGVLLNQI